MVVTCPKCATKYDFSDALIGPKGTVVRCTQCGHMFKIFADDGDDQLENAGWMIRKRGGKVFGIDRFSTIQRMIREGKIARDDALSRTGKSWKRLGDIVELQALFREATSSGPVAAAPADDGPRLSVHPDSDLMAEMGAQVRETTAGRPGREPEPDVKRGLAARPQSPPHPEPPAEPSPVAAAREPELDVPVDEVEPEPATVQGPLARSLSLTDESSEQVDMDEGSDDLLMPQKRGWVKVVVAIVILAVVGSLAGLGWWQRSMLLGWWEGFRAPMDRSEREDALETAHQYYLEDSPSYFDQSESILRDILAADENDSDARIDLAELLATRAQYARDRKHILGGEEGVDDAGTLAREAVKLARLAVLADSEDLEANRVLADALRLEGDLEEARKYLNKALDIAPRDPETLYVAVLLDWDEGLGLERAVDDLERIVKRDDSILRIRYRLALFYALVGRDEDAETEARAILDMNEDHSFARDLLELLDNGASLPVDGAPVAEEPDTAYDASEDAPGDPVGEDGPAVEPEEQESPSSGSGEAGGGGSGGGGVPSGKSYDFYMGKAHKAQASGDCSTAIDFFGKALEVKPGSEEALSGSGYCHITKGQYSAAISTFKRALKSNTSYGPALIGLAKAYEKNGNISSARKYYEKYLDAYSSGAYSALARNKLEALEDTIGPEDGADEGGGDGEPEKVVVPEKETEVEIKGSVGQPSGDTPTTAGDPYD